MNETLRKLASHLRRRETNLSTGAPNDLRSRPPTLRLQCFPGVDYVKHYAAYLSLKGETRDSVHYTLPSDSECLQPRMPSNIRKMGLVDIVLVGYVHGLERWGQAPWEGDDSNEPFA